MENESQNKKEKLNNNKRVPTLKQQEWLRQTVITKNPTEAARMVYDVKDGHNASVIASENLAKPYLREALNDMLKEYGLVLQDTIKEHKWVISQKKDIATKLKGIQEHYEILGLHPKKKEEDEHQSNIAIIISRDLQE